MFRKHSREDVLLEVEKNGFALAMADSSFRKDKEFVLECIKLNFKTFDYADESLKRDRDFILRAMKQDVSQHLESNNFRNFILQSVRHTVNVLSQADHCLRYDRRVVIQAIEQGVIACDYADEALKRDREFNLEVGELNRKISVAFYDLMSDEPFLLETSLQSNDNKIFVEKAVSKCGLSLQYASDFLKKDAQIVEKAAKQNAESFRYADESLRKDREFVLKLVKENGRILNYCDETLWSDIILYYYLFKTDENEAKNLNSELFEKFEHAKTESIHTKLIRNTIIQYSNQFGEEQDLYFCVNLQNISPRKQNQAWKINILFTNNSYSSDFIEKLIILQILRKISSLDSSSTPSVADTIDYYLFCVKLHNFLIKETNCGSLSIKYQQLHKVIEIASKFPTTNYAKGDISKILFFFIEWTRNYENFMNHSSILTCYTKLGSDFSKVITAAIGFLNFKENTYDLISVLGMGGEGVAFKAFSKKLNQLVAIKINFDKIDLLLATERIDFIRRNDIEGKIKCYECDLYDGYMYSIMEIGEETLFDFISRNAAIYQKRLITKQYLQSVLDIFIKILQAAKSVHDHNIAHRDLDPKNIVKVRDQFKIIDFDIAKVIKSGYSITLTVGKFAYMAPEVSHKNYTDDLVNDTKLKNDRKISTSCDTFSLGCIFLKLLINCSLKLDKIFFEDSTFAEEYDDKYFYFTESGYHFHDVLITKEVINENKLHYAIQQSIDQFINPEFEINEILTKCIITMIQKDATKRLDCLTHINILTKVVEFLNGQNITIIEILNEMKNYKEVKLQEVLQIMNENEKLKKENTELKKTLTQQEIKFNLEKEELNFKIKELQEKLNNYEVKN